jgi:hypothetical protein
MITVIAHYPAAAGAADAVRQLLARHAAAARAVPNDPERFRQPPEEATADVPTDRGL